MRSALRRQITERLRWQHEYAEAKAQTVNDSPYDTRSATGLLSPGLEGDKR